MLVYFTNHVASKADTKSVFFLLETGIENYRLPFRLFFSPHRNLLGVFGRTQAIQPEKSTWAHPAVFSPSVKEHWGAFHCWPGQELIIITHRRSHPCSSPQKNSICACQCYPLGIVDQRSLRTNALKVASGPQTLTALFISKSGKDLEVRVAYEQRDTDVRCLRGQWGDHACPCVL